MVYAWLQIFTLEPVQVLQAHRNIRCWNTDHALLHARVKYLITEMAEKRCLQFKIDLGGYRKSHARGEKSYGRNTFNRLLDE